MKTIVGLQDIYPKYDFEIVYWYSTQCPYKCPYCVTRDIDEPKQEIFQDAWVSLFSAISKYRPGLCLSFVFTGKEATCDPALFVDLLHVASAMKYAQCHSDSRIVIQTNLQCDILELEKLAQNICVADLPIVLSTTYHGKYTKQTYESFLNKALKLEAYGLLESIKIMNTDELAVDRYHELLKILRQDQVELSWVYGVDNNSVDSQCIEYNTYLQAKRIRVQYSDGSEEVVSLKDLVNAKQTNFKGMKCKANDVGMLVDHQGYIWGSCGHALQNFVGLPNRKLSIFNRNDIQAYFEAPYFICPNTVCMFDSILYSKGIQC